VRLKESFCLAPKTNPSGLGKGAREPKESVKAAVMLRTWRGEHITRVFPTLNALDDGKVQNPRRGPFRYAGAGKPYGD